MFWQEDIKEQHFTLSEDIQDAVFNINSEKLPIDHAYLLAESLLAELPWLAQVKAGIFDISVPDGNGWKQNFDGGFYYPSKRSKLIIRVPKERLSDAQLLVGKTLNLEKYQIKIIKALPPKLMSSMQVMFAKRVACGAELTEEEFLQSIYSQLQALGIEPKKMLSGLNREIKTPDGIIHTRSLMVADLRKSEAVILQEKGLGEHHLLGCGLFLPQKDIDSVAAV